MRPEEKIQRERYATLAGEYDGIHADPEHIVAMSYLEGILRHVGAESVLDVGAGAGRTMMFLRRARPDVRIMGIEPVEELRKAAYRRGVRDSDLINGDGYALAFADGEFDVVCEFGVLHHVREPNRVVAEMLRVARKAIFISDANNFGGGRFPVRLLKQLLHQCGLWGVANYMKTGGKGYSITEGDGLFYSYSVFDSLKLIRGSCSSTHLLNTTTSGPNLYRSAPHLAVLGIKRQNQ